MATQHPYTLLREQVNPLIVSLSDEERPSSDPFLSILGLEDAGPIQSPNAGEISIFAYKSQPAICVGDSRNYTTGTKDFGTGKIKMQFFTEQVTVSEDELERIEQMGASSILSRSIQEQRIFNNRYLITQIQKYAINPWAGVLTSADYNEDIIGMFASSSGGTISDPSDLNATAGTPIDLSSTVILQGSNRTVANFERLMTYVDNGYAKVDFNSKMVFPYKKMYVGMHPGVYAALKCHDLLNSTTGQLSERTLLEMFEDNGIEVVQSVWFDSDYALAEDVTSQLTFFTDPALNFKMLVKVTSNGSEVWSPWDKQQKIISESKGIVSLAYETHKSLEIGFFATPYHMFTAAATSSYFKSVFIATITIYDNVS